MAGKRGKSGRKSAGEFSGLSSSLTIRIPDDMRRQLESEAAARNQSIAQVLLWHLRRSFNRSGELERHSSIRAFCFLISELADRIGQGNPEWRHDPFKFKTFRIAVAKLLDVFQPVGEIRAPTFLEFEDMPGPWAEIARSLKKTWKTPQSAANDAVRLVLLDLRGGSEARQGWEMLLNAKVSGEPDEDIREAINEDIRETARLGLKMEDRTEYGMANVRRDLELKPEGKGND
jgi:hypothetical protein